MLLEECERRGRVPAELCDKQADLLEKSRKTLVWMGTKQGNAISPRAGTTSG